MFTGAVINFKYLIKLLNTLQDFIVLVAKLVAKYSGVSPVTYASGMTKLQMANARGNRKLNEIFYRIALTSVMPLGTNKALINPTFYTYYQKKISEGKLKNQALKCVQRRLVNIVFRVMKEQRPYTNPELGYVPKEKDSSNPVHS